MTKETALTRLMSEYPASRSFESFFRKVVDDFAGESKTIDKECYSQMKAYLSSLT